MVETLIITALLVGISFLLLGLRIFFVKGGKFPDIHIDGNKALRKKGIHCARSQDIEARKAGRNI